MNSHLRCGFASILLLCSNGVAAAQGSAFLPSDILALTGAEEHLIWESVVADNSAPMRAPSGFLAMLDAAVPGSLKLHPFPASVVERMPELRGYEYTMVDNELLIVNPIDSKIVDIITQ
jgi:Protein of unknown function (DUF1236)